MAGKKNPWGSAGKGKPSNGDAGEAASGDKSDGPRNPWLPGGGDDKRRSASIEDIFKNRGPEGAAPSWQWAQRAKLQTA